MNKYKINNLTDETEIENSRQYKPLALAVLT